MIEPLESRIAPALVFHFTDVDGDAVTVKVSKGSGTDVKLFKGQPNLLGGRQLQIIQFDNPAALKGANLTITAKPQDANQDGFIDGDGLVNVGLIDATAGGGIDLGAIKIKGDLACIQAGDATAATPGVKSLNVLSLGRFGLTTGSNTLASEINGALTSLKVSGDTAGTMSVASLGRAQIGGTMALALTAARSIGSVKIGHDLEADITGGDVVNFTKIGSISVGGSFTAGEIHARAGLGSVKIGGDLRGELQDDGKIFAGRDLGRVTIGGSVLGGDGDNTAFIQGVGKVGSIRVAGNIIGGEGSGSGHVEANGGFKSLSVGGSIIGGTGEKSGDVLASDSGKLKIGHDLLGGVAAQLGDPTPISSGFIDVTRISSITIGGSIVAGFGFDGAGLTAANGGIRSFNEIGALTVKGNVVGGEGGAEVVISARGEFTPSGAADVAIGKINIGGRIEHARILAGYSFGGAAVNADAQIGSVTVGGDWISSLLIAGVQANGNGFANGNDGKINNPGNVEFKDNSDATGAISKIGKVTIKGSAIGTADPTDAAVFAIEAQQIVSIKVGGAKEKLKAGRSNDIFNLRDPLGATLQSGGTSDFYAFEV